MILKNKLELQMTSRDWSFLTKISQLPLQDEVMKAASWKFHRECSRPYNDQLPLIRFKTPTEGRVTPAELRHRISMKI